MTTNGSTIQNEHQRANTLLMQGREAEALALFLWILNQEPNHTPTGRALAHLYLRDGKPEEALTLFRQLEKDGPEHPGPSYFQAYLYRLMGSQDQAIQELQLALDKAPDFADAQILARQLGIDLAADDTAENIERRLKKCEEWIRAGSFERAYPVLLRLVKNNPRGLPIIQFIVQQALETRNPALVDQIYQPAAETCPELSFEFHLIVAKYYFSTGAYEKCYQVVQKAIEMKPTNQEVCSLLLRVANELKDINRAEALLKDLHARNLYSPSTFFALASIYAQQTNWLKAKEAARACIMLNPRLAGVQKLYSQIKLQLGEPVDDDLTVQANEPPAATSRPEEGEAETQVESQVRETGSDDKAVQEAITQARQLYSEGLVQEAFELVREPVLLNPGYGPGIHFVFKICADHKMLNQAEEIYRKVVQAGRGNHYLYLSMAKVYAACNLTYRSIDEAKKAIQVYPQAHEAFDILFKVFTEIGNPAEAAHIFEDYLREDSSNAHLHLVLAKTYLALMDWERAEKEADAALAIQPRLSEALNVKSRAAIKKGAPPAAPKTPRPVGDWKPPAGPEAQAATQTASAHLREAERYYQQGDYTRAFKFYIRWAEATGSLEDFLKVGQIFERLGQPGKAEYAYNKAVQVAGDNPVARAALNRILKSKGGQAGQAANPVDSYNFFTRAEKFREMGKFPEAFDAYLKWAEQTQAVEDYYKIGQFCEEYKQLDKAETMYVTALGLDPQHEPSKERLEAVRRDRLNRTNFSIQRIKAWLDVGLQEKAIETFREGVKQGSIQIHDCSLAVAYFYHSGGIDMIARCVQELGEMLPQDHLLVAHCQMLLEIYLNRSAAEVKPLVDKVVDLGLEKSSALLYCGKAFGAVEAWEQAHEYLYQSNTITEGNPETRLALGLALLMLSRYPEAIQVFRAISASYLESVEGLFTPFNPESNLSAIPERFRLKFTEALQNFEEGRYQEAARLFSAAMGKSGEILQAVYNLSITYIHLGKYDLATRLLARVLSTNPRNNQVSWNMAVALFRQGLLHDTIRMLENYLSMGNSQRAWICHGYINNRLGEVKQALNSFQQARLHNDDYLELTVTIGVLTDRVENQQAAQEVLLQLKDPVFYRSITNGKAAKTAPMTREFLYRSGAVSISLSRNFYTEAELIQVYDELLELGALNVALEFFADYAALKPNYVVPVRLLAMAYLEQGRVQEAYQAWKEYAQRNPKHVKAQAALVSFCVENNLKEEALAALQSYVTLVPEDEEAQRQLKAMAGIHAEPEPAPAAPPAAERMSLTIGDLELDRPFYQASELRQIYEKLISENEFDLAIAFFGRYADQHPAYVTGITLLADSLAAAGRVEESLQAFQSYMQVCGDPQALEKIRTGLNAFMQKHGLLEKEEAPVAPPVSARKLPFHDPRNDEERTPIDQLYDLWRAYQFSRDFDKAYEDFAERLQANENSPDLHEILGYVLENLEEIERAYEHRKRAAELFNRVNTWISLGRFCMKNRMTVEAREALQKALDIEPDNLEAKRFLVSIERAERRPVRRENEDGRPDAKYLNDMWRDFNANQDYQNARVFFQSYCDKFPDFPTSFEYLAYALGKLGLVRDAYHTYQHYCGLIDRGDDEVFKRLGAFCESLKLHEEAIAAYQQALERNPFQLTLRESLSILDPANYPEALPLTGKRYTEDLARNLCRNPRDRASAEKLYNIFIDGRATDRAIETFRILQQRHPGEAYLYECLGYILLENRQYEEALEQVQLARRNAPEGDHLFLNKIAQQALRALDMTEDPSPVGEAAPVELAAPPEEAALREESGPPEEGGAPKEAGPEPARPKLVVSAPGGPDQPAPASVQTGTGLLVGPEGEADEGFTLPRFDSPLYGEIDLQNEAPLIADIYRDGLPALEPTAYRERAAGALERAEKHLARARSAAAEGSKILEPLCRLGSYLTEYSSAISDHARARAYMGETLRLFALKPDAIPWEDIVRYVNQYLLLLSRSQSLRELLEDEEEELRILSLAEGNTPGLFRDIYSGMKDVLSTISKYISVPGESGKREYSYQALTKIVEMRKRVNTNHNWPNLQQKKSLMSFIYSLEDNLKREERVTKKNEANLILEVRKREVQMQDGLIPVRLEVRNQGKGLAENIIVRLASSRDYQVEKDISRVIPVLVPDQAESLEFLLRVSNSVKRKDSFGLRFEFEYNDLNFGKKQNNPPYKAVITLEQTVPFVPFPNPYIVGPPISRDRPEDFFGRKDVISQINDTLSSANNILLMWGVRRVGKTSILQSLLRVDAQSPYIPVFIDMQGFASKEFKTGELLHDIAGLIAQAIRARGVMIAVPSNEQFCSQPIRTFREFVIHLAEQFPETRVLLMFDEFETMFTKIKNGHIEPDFLQNLRSLMQHYPKLGFIFTGADELLDLVNRYGSVMFNIAIPLKISFLDRRSASDLVVKPVEEAGVRYEENAVDRILTLTGCHPYFVQLMCHQLVKLLLKDRRYDVTQVDVEIIVDSLVNNPDHENFFAQLWDPKQVSIENRLVIACIASKMAHEVDWVPGSVVLSTLRDLEFPLGEDEFLRSVGHLRNRDILEERDAPDGSTEYRIMVPLFYRWYKERRSLNKVMADYTSGEEGNIEEG